MGTVGFPPGNRIPKDRKGEGMAVHVRNTKRFINGI